MPLSRPTILVALMLFSALPARADKLDKDSKAWLDSVSALITPDEEKAFKGLKDKSDRDEFQKIFWARRNPQGPDKEQNEFKAAFEKARPEADQRFKGMGRVGSQTDCGRVFLLIGEPSDVKKAEVGAGPTWTLKDRPGFTFPGGKVDIAFDQVCGFPEGSHLTEFLNRVAGSKIISPNIAFKMTSDGHLTKLTELLPKPTPVQALLKDPRQDFPVSGELTMILRTLDGADYLAGLIRGDASGLTLQTVGDKKTVHVMVTSQALDEGGRKVGGGERETNAEVDKDGSFVVSFGLTVKSGSYTVKAAVLDPKANKGSVASIPAKAPDLNSGDLALSSLLVLRDVQQIEAKDAQDPLADFMMGDKARLLPRFGKVFSPADTIQILCGVYNPKVDPATQKPSVTVTLEIQKDGQPIAKAPDETYDVPTPNHLVGPVALTKYAPGKYVVEIKVRDNVAKKDLTQQTGFEVR
ncbi:MAG TPA: GWxTD domain-containing protein [Vicinamibacteria bacterium]|jgi:GWxTD domain-containing protein|nr:GWxTD domain-containing protein [Vicinamibacteria bacterium]